MRLALQEHHANVRNVNLPFMQVCSFKLVLMIYVMSYHIDLRQY